MGYHIRIYDHDDELDLVPPDELATCVALLQGAKIRAEKFISNPWGQSFLQEAEQQIMDAVSSDIDRAVAGLEALREALK